MPDLAAAEAHLRAACPVMAAAIAAHGLPPWRDEPKGFATLARIIAGQQISVAAARSIWARVSDWLGEITAESVHGADDETLRACGLSRPKIRHLKSLADAERAGQLCFDALHALPHHDAEARLMSVSGVGPWTASVYCLFARGDLDAFPASDVALMAGWAKLAGLRARPDAKAFTAQAETWRPARGLAAHILWAEINRGRPVG